jgi:hypothetical protein
MPLVAVSVRLWPEQTSVAVRLTGGGVVFCEMVLLATAVQPLAPVTVTE